MMKKTSMSPYRISLELMLSTACWDEKAIISFLVSLQSEEEKNRAETVISMMCMEVKILCVDGSQVEFFSHCLSLL